MKWAFWRKEPTLTPVARAPVPGEVRMIKSRPGPWPQEDRHTVKVIDVRDGYVRYYMNSYFPDNVAEIDTFNYMYNEVVS